MEQNQQESRKSEEAREKLTWLTEPFSHDGTYTGHDISAFRSLILAYYASHGRELPWRNTSDPYRILVSEMMLQQTQVSRVLEKYWQFLSRFPSLEALADAALAEVFSLWQGLGYNRRAKALHDISRECMRRWKGRLPERQEELLTLPMIGPATAAALAAFAWNKPALYLETNIRRVLLYCFFSGAQRVRDQELYPVLDAALDCTDPKNWYYALMDYGVFLKTAVPNPNSRSAHYVKQAPFKNSNRHIRGSVLLVLNESGQTSLGDLKRLLDFEDARILQAVLQLVDEGLLVIIPHAASGRYPLEARETPGSRPDDDSLIKIP